MEAAKNGRATRGCPELCRKVHLGNGHEQEGEGHKFVQEDAVSMALCEKGSGLEGVVRPG